jgi:hypothetical protein
LGVLPEKGTDFDVETAKSEGQKILQLTTRLLKWWFWNKDIKRNVDLFTYQC